MEPIEQATAAPGEKRNVKRQPDTAWLRLMEGVPLYYWPAGAEMVRFGGPGQVPPLFSKAYVDAEIAAARAEGITVVISDVVP